MFRRIRRAFSDATLHGPESASDDVGGEILDDPAVRPAGRTAPDLVALPIVGITRRRTAGVVGGLLAAWIVIVFARQVSEAAAATARADDIAAGNAERQGHVAALERELDLIARQRYVVQQARGYGLGGRDEIPFTLAADAPALPDDAPGSAAVRVGADIDDVTPLERWLTVLFGSSD